MNTPNGASVITELEKVGVVFTDLEITDFREAALVARIVAKERLTRSEIDLILGTEHSARAIEKFQEFDLLTKDGDEHYCLSHKFQEIRSHQALKMLARLIVECHSAVVGNLWETRIQGLNDEGVDAVYQLIGHFQLELSKILTNPKFHGQRVFGVTLNSAFI
jgi:hypothetical protein